MSDKDSVHDTISSRSGDELHLLDLLIALAKHKRIVLGLPAIGAAISIVVTLLLPNVYTGVARVLPPQQNQSASAAILSQLTGFAGSLGLPSGLKNPSELYVGMLKSDTIADRLIKRFGLMEVFQEDTLIESRKELSRISTISHGKDSIITIQVDDEDPARAANIANAYVEELVLLNDSLALTEAAQRRLFFEKQLKETKDALVSAEIDLKRTQERTGLIKLDEQGKAIIEAVAQVRAQIAGKEVQIGGMKMFATRSNPDLIRAETELSALREQLRRIERDPLSSDASVFVPTTRVPEAGLEYVRRFREMKYQESLFEQLAKQYELARLDEAKDAAIVQIIDKAVTPDKKSKPHRALIVAITTFLAGALGILLAFMREALEKMRHQPDQSQRLALLARYVWRKGS